MILWPPSLAGRNAPPRWSVGSYLGRCVTESDKQSMLQASRLIGVSHSPTNQISAHRKLLRDRIAKLNAERRSPCSPGQRVSHIQKAAIIHNFRSATSTPPLRSLAWSSCAESAHHDKRCETFVSDIDVNILRNSAVTTPGILAGVSAVPCIGPLALHLKGRSLPLFCPSQRVCV